jgi:CheY-like chemotaxis protein
MPQIQGVEHVENRPNVLIIEDDLALSKTMELLLVDKCNSIKIVEEGEDGLKLLEEDTEIDIVFLDYHLPKMDGKTFCHILRTSHINKSNPNLWIIAHTKEHKVEIIEQMFAAGINDYLPKPINPQTFISRLLVAQYAIGRRREIDHQYK